MDKDRILQNWTGMTEEQLKFRRKAIKVCTKIHNYKHTEYCRHLYWFRIYATLGFKIAADKALGITTQSVEINKTGLEASYLKSTNNEYSQDINKIPGYSEAKTDLEKHQLEKAWRETRILKILKRIDEFKHKLANILEDKGVYAIEVVRTNIGELEFTLPGFNVESEEYLPITQRDKEYLAKYKFAILDIFFKLCDLYNCRLFYLDEMSEKYIEIEREALHNLCLDYFWVIIKGNCNQKDYFELILGANDYDPSSVHNLSIYATFYGQSASVLNCSP